MDRQEIERCLAQVEAYRASGQKAKAWAQANGVELGTLGSWCGHARRWQARLEGVSVERAAASASSGFVAARVAASPAATAATVRIELNVGGAGAGAARLDLHWPLTHARELGVLLKEIGR